MKRGPAWRIAGTLLGHGLLAAGFALLCQRSLFLRRDAATACFAGLDVLTLVSCLNDLRRRRKGKRPGLLRDLLALALVLPMVMGAILYESFFWRRVQTTAPLAEYAGLMEESRAFSSNRGQPLCGYFYWVEGGEKKGVVVLAHGNGVGHRGYMSVIDFFAQKGFYVFAYDATGYDASGGRTRGGLPQGIVDLDRAISCVEADSRTKDLPICLFGHSWGAYCAAAALKLHPEVRAVASLAGFNASADMIEAQGRGLLGPVIEPMLPYISLYEALKFGRYADLTAMDGFAASQARVVIVHSADDAVVPPRYGYDRYFTAYEGDPRFTFIHCEDRGHSGLFSGGNEAVILNAFAEPY